MGTATDLLLRALVDDAGLFPPTELPMPDAVRRHRADARTGHPMLTHRFLCPLSRWEELRSSLADDDAFDVGLILDTEEGLGGAAAAVDPRVRITHYEARVPSIDAGKAARFLSGGGGGTAAGGAPVYIELEPGPGRPDAVAGLSGAAPLGAKIRCGGVRADLFPDIGELADFVTACAEGAVPFKATAGLHHAARHTDPETGFPHHGYLNLLLATAKAVNGHGDQAVRAALAVTDPERLAAEAGEIPLPVARRTRELFCAYGSCSTRDPVAEAERLGLHRPHGGGDTTTQGGT